MPACRLEAGATKALSDGRHLRFENQREQINTRTAHADFYQQDKSQIGETQNRLAALEKELAAAYAHWEALKAQGS